LALAQEGADVLVAEAGEQLNPSPRATTYFSSTLVALEALGLLPDLEAVGVKVRQFGFHAPAYDFRPVISLDVLRGITFDYQLHAGQDVVAGVAMAHLLKAGGRVAFSHRLVGLGQTPGNVVCDFETRDGPASVTADWVIGADGARSTVRRLLDVDFSGHTWTNRFVATNIYCDMAALGYQPANFICDPVYGGVVAQIDAEGLWRLTYHESGQLPVESFMERLPGKFAGFIPEDIPYEIDAAQPYVIHQRCAERLRVGRVVLAGDAAHATNPCGGLGLTTGVWTGLLAADLIGGIRNGEVDAGSLDRFSEMRRKIFWEVTSPGASENKRMMEESDPAQRLRDVEGVRKMAEDVETAKLMLCFPFRVIGQPIRPNSRWTGVDPTAAAGVRIDQRASQLA
jgi:2-polyprenyl-6-methoxyphenol hydroxylase-like FAD-dependent oxidoreductase